MLYKVLGLQGKAEIYIERAEENIKIDIDSDDGTQPPFDESKRYMLTKVYLDSISKDVSQLQEFITQASQFIQCYETDPAQRAMSIVVSRLQGKAEDRFERAKEEFYSNDAKKEARVEDIEFRMDATYKGNYDLTRFTQRIMDLYDWHQSPGTLSNKKPYFAPYFPIIQSSGMGKTRLMLEFKKSASTGSEVKVVFLLCIPASTSFDMKPDSIYDEILQVPSERDGKKRRDAFLKRLTEIKNASLPTHGKVVFFLDEAQHLLTEDGFLFRCFRWWLCCKDNTKERAVVSVLAGTSSALANFYRESPEATFSRGVINHWEIEKKLYEPFFDLTTVGCFKDQTKHAYETEFERAIPYGRPLFALMQQQTPFTKNAEKMQNILRRMLLGLRQQDWTTSAIACLSILATRVQMGHTSRPIVSTLVSKGYCNLSGYSQIQSEEGGDAVVNFCYFTDPVCAQLSMRLMVTNSEAEATSMDQESQEPIFWTTKALEIFASGMCRPNKGDVGEVAVALYLLFCGDILRKRNDAKLFTLSINLESFLSLLMKPSNSKRQVTTATTNTDTINFIQFSKCYLQLTLDKMLTQDFLKHIYESATACYLYDNFPAIDVVASIRKSDGTYSALLISIKAQETFGNSDVLALREAIDTVSNNLPQDLKPLCLICLVGRQGGGDLPPDTANHTTVEEPRDDPFGVTDLVLMSTGKNELSEIYSSHHYLEPFRELQPTDFLRKARKKQNTGDDAVDSVDYLHKVLSDFSKQEEPSLEE